MFRKRQYLQTSRHARTGRRVSSIAFSMIAVLGLAACSGVVSGGTDSGGESPEVTLRVATMAVPNTPNAAVQDWFLDEVEERTDGRVQFDRFAPESLCTATEIVECVRDGRAEIGISVPAYTPAYFADEAIVGIPFLAYDGAAVMRAYYSAHNANDEVRSLYDDNGLTYVGMWPAGRLLFGSKVPIDDYTDLSGQRIRATGVGLQSAVTVAGGNVVAVPQAETYEAVERGVIDIVGAPLDGPVNYRQVEVLPFWTDAGTGQYASFAIWLSKNVYDGLPDDLREIVDDVIEEFNAGPGWDAFNDSAATMCEEMLAAPTLEGFTRWSDDAVDAWRTALGDTPKEEWMRAAASAGITDPQTYFDQYTAALEEYTVENPVDATVDCIDAFADR